MMEPRDFDRFVRHIEAIGDKADDPEGFAQLVVLTELFTFTEQRAAERLKKEGYSYADLARPLGITRQACFYRYRTTPGATPTGR